MIQSMLLSVAFLTFVQGPVATAEEAAIPQTTVVRISKSNPDRVEVVHLDRKPESVKNVADLKFQEVALNAESSGVTVTAGNEFNATSSKSSLSFGIGFGIDTDFYGRYYDNYYGNRYRPVYHQPNYYRYHPSLTYKRVTYRSRVVRYEQDNDWDYLYCDYDRPYYRNNRYYSRYERDLDWYDRYDGYDRF